jgi:DNA-binding CsgD family transcriptional regulator
MTLFNSKKGEDNLDVLPFKIKDIINTCILCSNLNITVYNVEKKCFLYCNEAFNEFSKIEYKTLLKNGWASWFLIIDPKESSLIKKQVSQFLSKPNQKTAIILKYHIITNHRRRYIKHEISLYYIKNQTIAVNYFFDISDQERIASGFRAENNQNNARFKIASSQIISPREIQVLQLIADGFSSKQIANQLFISNHTAISHRKHLIEKFQVKNTAQLIKKASKVIEL